MIKTIKVTGIAYEVDDATHEYVIKKIGNLDKYIPRHARKSISANVKLEQINHDNGNKYQTEVNIDLPGKTINSKGSADTMLSAIDLVEDKVRTQLREYKNASIDHIGNRGVMSRFKRSFKREL